MVKQLELEINKSFQDVLPRHNNIMAEKGGPIFLMNVLSHVYVCPLR